MSLDVNGDGRADSAVEIMSQYQQWRNGVTAILRQKLGPEAIMIANTAGEGADPNLNGITLESEACGSFEACRGWLSDQAKIGAKPSMSVIWTCDATTPAEVTFGVHTGSRLPRQYVVRSDRQCVVER